MELNDSHATAKVIGCLLKNNELIEDDQYPLNNNYFYTRLDIISFAAIYNIYQNGIRKIDINHIIKFLENYPDQFEFFNSQNGQGYIEYCINEAEEPNYAYYYTRLKKFALLRSFNNLGFNISNIYNTNEDDPVKRQQMEERFNLAQPEEIVTYFEKLITNVDTEFHTSNGLKGGHAGENIEELYASLKETPEMGLGLNGNMLNTIVRGARLRKLYIRSAATGVGKTRTLAASAAQLGVGTYYDIFKKDWITTNSPQPCLYITSEQELQEIQTIVLAFVSGVPEDRILDRKETPEEATRIVRAMQLIKNGGLFIEPIGDYGIRALTNMVKRHKQTRNIKYCFHDYVHSSLTLMNEISEGARLSNLREDQMLLMLTNTLKNLCNQLGIFIFSSTQLNRSYKTEEKMDATVIRGALSIIDKVDYASIMMNVDKDELDLLNELLDSNQMSMKPNVVTHIFKNRRQKYVDFKLYSYLDKSTGQMIDLFALNYSNEIVEIEPIQIIEKL